MRTNFPDYIQTIWNLEFEIWILKFGIWNFEMLEVCLTYPTPDGSREIAVEPGKVSFGRGSEADHRFPDDGLSRLHAAVHREGDNVWILDENSTNGTFVNDEPVPPRGTPLRNGDEIRIGHRTKLNVRIFRKAEAAASAGTRPETSVSAESHHLPLRRP